MSPLAIAVGVLWILVIGLSLIVLALVRQLGVLHERITPVGALMLAKGLKVGEMAPELTVADLADRSMSIGGARADGRSTLLMFVSPTCPVCKALLPVLIASRNSEKSWLKIVLASDGNLESQREFVAAQRLDAFSFVVSASLGMAYQVSRLPFAALIDADGVLKARGIINSREHLESLFEAQRLGVASMQDYFERAPLPSPAQSANRAVL
jgi:methylamine dehydrogenase accessory protein MauD